MEGSGQGVHEREMARHLVSDKSIEGHYVGQKPSVSSPIDGKPRTYFISINKTGAVGYMTYQFRLFRQLWSLTKEKRNTVLFVRYAPAMVAPVLISIFRGIPMVVRTGTVVTNLESYGKKVSRLGQAFIYATSYLHLKFAKKIIVVTETIKNSYVVGTFGVSAQKVVVSGNGCNPDIFKILDRKEAKCDDFNAPTDKVVVFSGSFYPDYGLDNLIKALVLLRKKYNYPVSALLVGDGGQRQELISMVASEELSDVILFPGRVDQATLCRILNCCDLAVITLNAEKLKKTGSSAIKLFEYAAAGIRIMATRHPDHEFIERQGIGRLCEPDDTDEMAQVMLQLLQESDDPGAKMRRREYILKVGTWEKAYERLRDICASCSPSSATKPTK